MQKHTPGPWEVDPEKKYRVLKYGSLCVVNSLAVAGLREGAAIEEAYANAALIAAAPDLLAFVRCVAAGNYGTLQEMEAAAARLVAKAEGEGATP
jgi:hypothetical protein